MKNFFHNLGICSLAIVAVLLTNYTLMVMLNTLLGGSGFPFQWNSIDQTMFRICFSVASFVSFILLGGNLDLKK